MKNSINSCLYIPEGAEICDISCEILPNSGEIVKGVAYQNINGKESIVDSVSRRILISLTNNPEVSRLESEDTGLCFRIRVNNPGEELATVYRVDLGTHSVLKTSHLFLKFIAPGGKLEERYILNATPESYNNILGYLKSRQNLINGIIVKVGKDWIPFSSLPIDDITSLVG